jgi:hypothetical protein
VSGYVNQKKGSGSVRGPGGIGLAAGTGGSLFVAALAAAVAGVILLPGAASASSVRCSAELTEAKEIVGFPGEENGLDYELFCNEPMKGFSVISNERLFYFSPEVGGFTPDGTESGELFSCEGDIPGYGFGCRALGSANEVAASNRFRGQIVTASPCPEWRGQPRLRLWLTATTTQLTATGTPFITSSQPFLFKNGFECPKPKPRRGSRRGDRDGDGKGGRR